MMQMPILSYPNFSHLLQLHHQQQQQQQHYQQQLASRLKTAESDTASLGSNSPSSSPPPSDTKPSKSFTIDAILGLREEQRSELKNRAFPTVETFHHHPRLHLPELNIPSLGLNLPNHSNHLTNRDTTSFRHQQEKPLLDSSNKKCGGGGGGGKSKRVRTIFTPEQLERLEAEFERQQYMVGPERLYLAHTLQLTEAQVKVWFQNRRIKWRKQHLEIQQQRLAILKQQQQQTHQRSDGDDSDESTDDIQLSPHHPYQTPIFNAASASVSAGSPDENFNKETLMNTEDFV